MSLKEFPKGSLMFASEDDVPPWSDVQKDAQIEALRYAWFALTRTLHNEGILDMKDVQTELEDGTWVFQDSPTKDAVNYFVSTTAYMHSKMNPFVKRKK